MSSFEYIMVIVAIILGLGLTRLLHGMVNALRAETETSPGLLHSLWVINVLVMHVGLWAIRWSGGGRDDWPFLVLLLFLFMPIVYFALAELLFPPAGTEVNLTEYFLANRRPFFLLMILVEVAGAFGPRVFYSDPAYDPGVSGLVRVPFLLLVAYSENRLLQITWAVLVFVGNLVFFINFNVA